LEAKGNAVGYLLSLCMENLNWAKKLGLTEVGGQLPTIPTKTTSDMSLGNTF